MTTESQPMLYCVGCGNPVARLPGPGDMLAISCQCGAYSPILVTQEVLASLEPVWTTFPASLRAILTGAKQAGHWENYLGDDPITPCGRAWKTFLIEHGLTSMADCPEDQCKRGIERRKYWQEMYKR